MFLTYFNDPQLRCKDTINNEINFIGIEKIDITQILNAKTIKPIKMSGL